MQFPKTAFTIIFLFAICTQNFFAQDRDRPSRNKIQERFKQTLTPTVGFHGGYDFDAENFSLGVQGEIPVRRFFRLAPSGDLYFGDDTYWQLNADIILGIPFIHPGGGLAVADGARVKSESTEIGYNLFIQVQPMRRRAKLALRPYAEIRWTFVNDEEIFRLALGIGIPI